MNDEQDEKDLADALAKGSSRPYNSPGIACANTPPDMVPHAQCGVLGDCPQWTTADNWTYHPAPRSKDRLPPGHYDIRCADTGIYFVGVTPKAESLLQTPQANSTTIIREIMTFWDMEQEFAHYGIPYRRGILLWGPPGSGKTCCVRMLCEDIVQRGGLVLSLDSPRLFVDGLRILRRIEPARRIVAVIEDIDALIRRFDESDILNVLDGKEQVSHIVFVATTNYPEQLGARIVNRPSRFDRRIKIGMPNAASRRIYLNHICGDADIPIERWVDDTEGFSFAHLKELFIGVRLLGNPYNSMLQRLRMMEERLAPCNMDGGAGGIGFHSSKEH